MRVLLADEMHIMHGRVSRRTGRDAGVWRDGFGAQWTTPRALAQ